MFSDKCILPFADQVLHLPVKGFIWIPFPGRHPSDDRLFCTDMKSAYQFSGNITGIQNKGFNYDPETVSHIIYHRHDSIDVKDIAGDDVVPDRKSALLIQYKDQAGHDL